MIVKVKNFASPELRRLAAAMPGAVDKALVRPALVAQNMVIRQVNRIETGPTSAIPTKAQVNAYNRGRRQGPVKNVSRRKIGGEGTPAWKRTGGLLQAVKAPPIPARGRIALQADLPYARARHDLATAKWMPKNPALGIHRTNPYFAEAQAKVEPQLGAVFAQALLKELGVKNK